MIKFRLKELMAKLEVEFGRKLTFDRLSQYTGISRQTLARIASPKGCATSTENLERLCRFFKCTPDQLLIFDPPLPAARRDAALAVPPPPQEPAQPVKPA